MNRRHRIRHRTVLYRLCLLWAVGLPSGGTLEARAAEGTAYVAMSTNRVDILPEQLQWLIKPLTLEEVEVEAEAWRNLLKEKALHISAAEISVKRHNESLQLIKTATCDAREAGKGDTNASAALQRALTEFQQAEAAVTNDEITTTAVQAISDLQEREGEAAPVVSTNTRSATTLIDTNEARSAQKLEVVLDAFEARSVTEKADLLIALTKLRTERAAIIERFNVVLKDLQAKGGDVEAFEKYRDAVDEIIVDVGDTSAVLTFVIGWLTSETGGVKWALNLLRFVLVLSGFFLLAWVSGRLVQRAAGATRNLSELQKLFSVLFVRRSIIAVGLLIAVSSMGIPVAPLLALITAAGLVIGLALQGTLSNFASGLLLLFYRPFDIGDAIDAGGTAGIVHSMNLMSTLIRTWDNKVMVVPNNRIWGDVITNISRTDRRRVDLVFGISYGDSMDKAQAILERVATEHPKTLDEPAPVVRVHELGDSSVNFVVRPWVVPADYWEVYWDITRQVKEAFDREGICIPFPQRDVHVHASSGSAKLEPADPGSKDAPKPEST